MRHFGFWISILSVTVESHGSLARSISLTLYAWKYAYVVVSNTGKTYNQTVDLSIKGTGTVSLTAWNTATTCPTASECRNKNDAQNPQWRILAPGQSLMIGVDNTNFSGATPSGDAFQISATVNESVGSLTGLALYSWYDGHNYYYQTVPINAGRPF